MSDLKKKNGYGNMRQNKTKIFIIVLNVLLLFLLAFIGFNTVEKVLGAKREPITVESEAAKNNTLARNTLLSSNSVLPDYRAVWERNLFNTSQKTLSSPQKQVDLANVVEADETIGLKLLGTVVANNSTIKSAIIEYNKDQNIYHEGDRAGGYVIKKILRNEVIVATENGDKLLALTSDGSIPGGVVVASSSQPKQKASLPNRLGARYKSVELPREELMTAFNDINRLIGKIRISYKSGKNTGFSIGLVPANSILKKIGLRSHDKILALNDKPIEGKNGAFELFEKIAAGKKVTIKYRRRSRTRRIELNPI